VRPSRGRQKWWGRSDGGFGGQELVRLLRGVESGGMGLTARLGVLGVGEAVERLLKAMG
jgi:hypothetical protein